ncbi:precursor of fumarase fumarase [Phaeodactylum tricornutum CCAP 1055/1]|jgi:fumarate hydratase class I|uniref:fumarate hydratase n=1 Tax=Phaeodactylum tricornutum (strain CCAP 1055/1) TaxID=556484 RepID=B7FWX5_PHATC|nr:precursor of fumarase fumarase [Phaeodactylum tricornutum CCAP 1055/1]EEC49062.1 precursor of fumarase fumarase [Phaeodactylum tricornutum CCAP 1055/1]|eukprot:XP_002179239.1 precursor of fumarase fumarase [Phaeodactylum tricornutum CCAP 1055/1]
MVMLSTLLRSTNRFKTAAHPWRKLFSTYDHSPLFDSNIFASETVQYKRLLGPESVESVLVNGESYLSVKGEALQVLSKHAFSDVAHLLRPAHLQQLRNILDDPEASSNDHFVAMELLKNANIAAGRVLPGCQDTGTAIVLGKKGHRVLTDGEDEAYLANGAHDAYRDLNLRYSQVAPLDMFAERNTGNNMPAQIDLYSNKGNEYKFMFIAKGGGSANKTFLYQQTKALLNTGSLEAFLEEKIKTIGTSACPPYHLAIVIGGLSAELTLKTVKLASTKFYDDLPTSGDSTGRAFRDVTWEDYILKMTRGLGIGAQFGGKYFCHDVRVIRLPRHGASCPVGIGVSCSADRQVLGKVTKDGVFLERLEEDVSKYLPDILDDSLSDEVVKIDMNSMSMDELRQTLSKHPIRTRLSLSGTIVVARDIAHAKMLKRIEDGEGLPDYAKQHIIYYAGPAKTPEGYASGSFGPTTAGRMDAYVDRFMQEGGSFVSLAKGNRSKQVTNACKKYGGFYLGSIGGPAAILAKNCIKKVKVLDNEEDGMEAVWKIEVENFPAFIVVDDKGEDFFEEWLG